jgi:hypothetical protein
VDPDPTGPVTAELRAAIERYRAEVARRVNTGATPIRGA